MKRTITLAVAVLAAVMMMTVMLVPAFAVGDEVSTEEPSVEEPSSEEPSSEEPSSEEPSSEEPSSEEPSSEEPSSEEPSSEEPSSEEPSSEEPSSEEPSSEEPSSEEPHPEFCYLTFADPENGYADVSRGYVGLDYDNGVSVYEYRYGTEAEITLSAMPDAFFVSHTVDGAPASLTGENTVKILMTEDHTAEFFFAAIEFSSVTVTCNYAIEGLPAAVISANGAPVDGAISIVKETLLSLSFADAEGNDVYLASAVFTPAQGEPVPASIDNEANTVSLIVPSSGTLALEFAKFPIAVNITQAENGVITADNLQPEEGDRVTFTFTPAEGYRLKNINLNGIEFSIPQSTYVAIASDTLNITAVFEPIESDVTVTLSVKPDAVDPTIFHGTVKFTDSEELIKTVRQGTTVIISVTPETGYLISYVKINGTVATPDADGTLSVFVNEDITIEAEFRRRSFRITAIVTAEGGGTITAEGYVINERNAVEVFYGDTITFTMTPNMHYMLYTVKADSQSVYHYDASNPEAPVKNTHTFENVTSNHTLAVAFATEGSVITEYTITASAGANGSITPSGEQKVIQGETVVYTVTANEGYEIDYVTVDGIDVSLNGGAYTFTDVSGDHSIAAYFKAKAPVETGIISEGNIDWTTTVIYVDLTATQTVSKSVFGKMAVSYVGRTFRFKSADFEVTFTVPAGFVPPEEDVTFTALRDSLSPDYESIRAIITSSPQYSSADFTILALDKIFPTSASATVYLGARFAGKTLRCFVYSAGELVRVSDSLVCDGAGYTTVSLKGSNELVFLAEGTVKKTYKVNITAGENGTVTPNGTITVDEGGRVTFTAVPTKGYVISRVTAGGKALESKNGTYTISDIKQNTTVEVRFALEKAEESSKTGLIISIIIIAIAIVGGAVLFTIKWKQTRY